uniref:Uncharacterized protein n=1 Tax=Arundo donax TaxID=35708 RepID=A0A0A8Y8I4_ARUDO
MLLVLASVSTYYNRHLCRARQINGTCVKKNCCRIGICLLLFFLYI